MNKKTLGIILLAAALIAVGVWYYVTKVRNGGVDGIKTNPEDEAAYQRMKADLATMISPGDLSWILQDTGKRLKGEISVPAEAGTLINGTLSKTGALYTTIAEDFQGWVTGGPNATTELTYTLNDGYTYQQLSDHMWALWSTFSTNQQYGAYNL